MSSELTGIDISPVSRSNFQSDTLAAAGQRLPGKVSSLDNSASFMAFTPQTQEEFNKEAVKVITDWSNGWGFDESHWGANLLDQSLQNAFEAGETTVEGRVELTIAGKEFTKESLREFIKEAVDKPAAERTEQENTVISRLVGHFQTVFDEARPGRSPVPGDPEPLQDPEKRS